MKKKCLAVLAVSMSLALAMPVFQSFAGWELWGEQWYYSNGTDANGSTVYLKDTVTPDGFYVDGSGLWYVRTANILGQDYTASEKFVSPTVSWEGTARTGHLETAVSDIFEGTRKVLVSDSAIIYQKRAQEKDETNRTMMGLYKDADAGQYRLDLRLRLDGETTDTSTADYYNYQIFRALFYEISSTPELLEDAIYRAWEGDNGWNINRTNWVRVGDSLIRYTASDGCGRFYIAPAVYGQ